jgi:hypothetical protein
MANRTGIELLPTACRIVEVASRARVFGGATPEAARVRAFREIPYSAADPASLTAELRRAMKGLERRAAVAVWGLHSSHQAWHLPPASPEDLEALARRESRQPSAGLPSPPLADVVVAGALRDGRRETGYAAVAAAELQSRLQPLIDAGIRVEAAVTPALAHASLARQRRALLPDAVLAVLSVNARATALTVVHGQVVLFARELPWGDETERLDDERAPAGGAAFAARIASELRRSLVYLRQSRSLEVERVFVCGDAADLRALTGPLMTELSLDVETLDVGDDLDLSSLPEPSDAFRSRLGAWRTALALSTDASPLPALKARDLRPAARASALAERAAAAAVAGVLITAAGWGILGYLSGREAARQERLRRTIALLEPELQRRDEDRRNAMMAAARNAALGALASQGPRLARVMEALSQAAPADVALSAVRVEPGSASWRIVVEGQAEGADAGAAHAAFTRFLKALESSAALGRPVAPPSLRTRTADPAASEERPQAEAAAVPAERPPEALTTRRPVPAGPAYIEVARDGRLYRIPLRRQPGNLEADRQADEARRLQEAAAARQPAVSSVQPVPGPPERHPVSVVEFTIRYEVPK